MRLGGHQPGHRVIGSRSQQSTRRIRRGSQQPTRGAIGEGCLAGPLDPAQQPGVVQPPLVQGVDEGRLGRGVRDQVETVARVICHNRRASIAAQTRASTAS